MSDNAFVADTSLEKNLKMVDISSLFGRVISTVSSVVRVLKVRYFLNGCMRWILIYIPTVEL